MFMRRLLALVFRPITFVLYNPSSFSESIALDARTNRQAAAIVVCNQDIFACLVDSHIARTSAAGCNFIQKLKLSRFLVNLEGANTTALLALVVTDFVDCINVPSRRINRQKRGIRSLSDEPQRGCFT